MDSSNAEKAARAAYIAFHEGLSGFDAALAWDDMTSPADDWSQEAIDWMHAINVALSSRDAEVAALTGVIDSSARTHEELESEHTAALTALAESRARFADSEARRAELEAVIEKVREMLAGRPGFSNLDSIGEGMIRRVIESVPLVVLEDRDREVAARAVEDAAPQFIEALDAHYLVDDKNLGYYRTEVTCACGASWWYGEHEGDPTGQEMWDKHRVEVITARAAAILKGDKT